MSPDALQQHTEARRLAAEARRLDAERRRSEALARLRQAVLRHAEADRLYQLEQDEPPPATWREARANDSLLCGNWLAESDAHSEAAGIYQEAADAYGSLSGAVAESNAQLCAHLALESVAALRAHPEDRLYLLIAHYDRRQQLLALQEGTEEQQAECLVHIADVFARRDRPREAAERYAAALRLLEAAPEHPHVLLSRAECHHRLGGLFARPLNDLDGAATHYRAAIALYAAHEPPVYGRRQAHDLCVRALAELENRLAQEPDSTRKPGCPKED
jgi:hypothetical protein